MKKVTTLIFSIGVGITFAQPVINSSNFLQAGMEIISDYQSTNLPAGASVGGNGYQTWDFTQVSAENSDTFRTTNPAWTNYYNCYPNANVAAYQPNYTSHADYYLSDSSGFYFLGSGDNTPFNISPCIPYSMPLRYLKFPAQYGQSYTDSASQTYTYFANQGPAGPDSMRFRAHYKFVNAITAWGNVNTPLGSFNCIRIERKQTLIDSSWNYFPATGWNAGDVQIYRALYYEWYTNAPQINFPVAILTCNDSTNMPINFSWLKYQTTVSSITESPAETSVSVFPNPANSIISIANPELKNLRITIQSMESKLVYSGEFSANDFFIPINNVANGIYTCSVIDNSSGNQIQISKLIIQH
jgi:hypothetical protein